MHNFEQIKSELLSKANKEKAKGLQRFFKTGPDQYGEGDIFIGITVPEQRVTAKKFRDAGLKEIEKLLHDKIHECRLTALLILCEKFNKADPGLRKEIFELYMDNYEYINNWDLVDLSAPKIAGEYLLDKNRSYLYELAKSGNLWKQRIAVLASYAFIKNNDFSDTLKLSELLLNHKHDLIHKAVGWMLREAGKRNVNILKTFLNKHYKKMPRTMLRYAIEKLDENTRLKYLKGLA
ncbi:MAG: DNA alkylation repair protein [Spirochaetota bacterium]